MKTRSEIDATLRLLAEAQPPAGMERRIHARLATPRKGFTPIHTWSAAAVAASVAISAAALSPAIRRVALHQGQPLVVSPIAAPIPRTSGANAGFGAASGKIMTPSVVPIAPAQLGTGRGHPRSVHRVTSHSPARTTVPQAIAARSHLSAVATSSMAAPAAH
jgi:hypothetical protein